MDFLTVLSRLNDLPTTFKRIGAPYAQIVDSLGVELSTFTQCADATSAQVELDDNAVDGWLDVWGLLWGVPRNPNEANTNYHIRIDRTVQAWVGTLPGLQAWVAFYAPDGSVAENPSGLGYTVTLPAAMTPDQVTQFLVSLNRIRPAGVPFTVFQIGSGVFLGTEAFLATGGFAGAYLSAGVAAVPYPLGPCTPNAMPLLPTLLFDDPLINPPTP